MISNYNYISKVTKKILSLAFTLLILFCIIKIAMFYMPFTIALIFAMIIEPIIKKLMKKLKWTRWVSSVVVMASFFVILSTIIIIGTNTLFKEANKMLDGQNTYFDKTKSLLSNITNNKFLKESLPSEIVDTLEKSEDELINSLIDWITKTLNGIKNYAGKIPNLLMTIFFTLMALYFICTDKIFMVDQMEHHFPDNWSKKLTYYIHEITKSLGMYLKAEFTLIFISFVISLIGFIIFKMCKLNVPFPLLIALGIAFVDALPILGSGSIMVPWAIIEAINGDVVLGISIIILWLIMCIVRNLLEPKLVSKNIGIHPVVTLIAMYTGYKIFGLIGMFIGPILLIVLKEIYSPLIDEGIFRFIFE